ncbi:integrase core domain-containing protein [Arenibacterium halophilum]|uniref:integrase core domain-containing protein n=1 Tax=Arenibacterium halophilum TaxID=2583821 RepID=UPI003CCC7092
MALHRAGQADAERLRGELQRADAGRAAQRDHVRNLAHARIVIAAWAADYNTKRPHSALDYETPADYARALTSAIARPAARDDSSARRAIAQPAPNGVNTNRAPVTAG